jgi:alkylation response protein AidB-like acyl-CoA dehydrogenase
MTTDEFKEILDVSTKFASKEIGPGALEADLHPSTTWTESLWTKSMEVGFPGLLIPEDYRGFGQSALCGALVLDILATECAGVASVFAHHFAACTCIMGGNKKQKETYLPLLANSDTTGPIIGTVVFLPYLDDNKLTLSENNGKLTLSGISQLTGNALLARYFCVFLDEGIDERTITCIIIDRNTPGVRVGDSARFTGLKLNPFAPIIFNEVEVDPERIIGERGKGEEILLAAESYFHCWIAATAMGAARTAYRKARHYAQERYQYGTMIIHHQEIQRMLGNMLMKLSIGTSGYLRALTCEEANLPYSSPDARFAKIYCTDSAVEIVIDAIQIHGGYGYMHDYGVEKIMRDVKVLNLLGGSSPRLHMLAINEKEESK